MTKPSADNIAQAESDAKIYGTGFIVKPTDGAAWVNVPPDRVRIFGMTKQAIEETFYGAVDVKKERDALDAARFRVMQEIMHTVEFDDDGTCSTTFKIRSFIPVDARHKIKMPGDALPYLIDGLLPAPEKRKYYPRNSGMSDDERELLVTIGLLIERNNQPPVNLSRKTTVSDRLVLRIRGALEKMRAFN